MAAFGCGTVNSNKNAHIVIPARRESVHLIFGMLGGWRKPKFLDFRLRGNGDGLYFLMERG